MQIITLIPASAASRIASEAKAGGVVLTDEDVADLKEEYGPEMATAMLKILNKMGQKIGAVSPALAEAKAQEEKQAALEAAEAKRVTEQNARLATEQQAGLEQLKADHPDWKSVVRTANDKDFKPEFLAWAEKLTPADKRKLFNSWDMDFLSNKIQEYKVYLAAAVKPITTSKTVPNRLATATPATKSVASAAVTRTALDDQLDGYRSV